MPVVLALCEIWNRNFLDMRARAVLPYSERLRELPRYLQQLEMESNGKTVTRGGAKIDYATAPVIFGDCGTVGQHSFHQLLHQGSDIVPADFIGVIADDLKHPDHHRALVANMIAQAGALAFGKTGTSSPHDAYAGGRPSNLILLDRLDPHHFGMLIALYEHKVFTEGVIWELNSFDQPGVELGKQMARALEAGKTAAGKESDFLARLFSAASPVKKTY
jgi:glucose-6-phosphate isomerase